jgi:hypothetical protein
VENEKTSAQLWKEAAVLLEYAENQLHKSAEFLDEAGKHIQELKSAVR